MKTLFTLLFTLSFAVAFGQEKGQKIFVDAESTNENVKEIMADFKERLAEWGYWIVVESKSAADFTLKPNVGTSRGITATSWGGTSVNGSVEIFDQKGKSVWLSDTYKSSPNGTNGFNSKKAVAKKLINGLKKKFK